MEHREMVLLIRDGVVTSGGVWADLGAGTGNFTWALAELLGPGATIYALDRDARAIAAQQVRIARGSPGATVIPRQADVLQPLNLPPLDGALLANLLHEGKQKAESRKMKDENRAVPPFQLLAFIFQLSLARRPRGVCSMPQLRRVRRGACECEALHGDVRSVVIIDDRCFRRRWPWKLSSAARSGTGAARPRITSLRFRRSCARN